MNTAYYRISFYLLFAISGFTGLIYESIWSHYLKLFLGHAAYAQALVLTIFMGGMALGAWMATRYIHKFPNLFLAYALVEAITGVLGLGFHSIFGHVINYSYDVVFPSLESAALIHFYKWTVAASLILPQSLLLGMTFPLMSNAIIRLFPDSPGRYISILYFCNSIGAAAGVLISGFVLIAAVGLPGTIMTAAILNILLAIVVYLIAKPHIGTVNNKKQKLNQKLSGSSLFIIASFITGVASFIYEIAWIRMLSMVLGSSTHAFELMLSAFITGLALGGLWIRKYLDNFKKPILFAGFVQIIMGVFALATVPLYNQTFDLMAFFMSTLDRSENGYILFNLISHSIALLIMLPATFFAGMTLPLFTLILINKGYGEKSIGYIYASNTIGAIVGVIFTVLIGMPLLGLKGVILLGSSLDMILGVILITSISGLKLTRPVVFISSTCTLLLIFVGSLVNFDTERMASGVFRTGLTHAQKNVKTLAHFDGSTASISVVEYANNGISISTNGKPDASISYGYDVSPTTDEYTMTLLAAIPLSTNLSAKSIANIGFGSGLTTHTLLLSEEIERVDSIEIEPAMIEGAKYFEDKNRRAFVDPRSHIYIEDAKTYFHTTSREYDMVISVPSNPWVSGISSLFTEEFYGTISESLSQNGVFAQWLHTYESDIGIVLPILKTIAESFEDYHVYAASYGDIFIVASPHEQLVMPNERIFENELMKKQLSRVGVHNMHDITIRFLGDKKLLGPFINLNQLNSNSDFFPIIDALSVKSRFMNNSFSELHKMRSFFVPIVQILKPELEYSQRQNATLSEALPSSTQTRKAQEIYHFAVNNVVIEPRISELVNIALLLTQSKGCEKKISDEVIISALFNLHLATVGFLSGEHIEKIGKSIMSICNKNNSETVQDLLNLYLAYGERNMANIALYSQRMLHNPRTLSSVHNEYIFSSLILALVALEEYEKGLEIWLNSINTIYPNQIPFQLKVLQSILILNTQVVNLKPQTKTGTSYH